MLKLLQIWECKFLPALAYCYGSRNGCETQLRYIITLSTHWKLVAGKTILGKEYWTKQKKWWQNTTAIKVANIGRLSNIIDHNVFIV